MIAIRESRTLIVGGRFIATLPGLGAAGYRWAATIKGPAIVSVARISPVSGSVGRPAGASQDEAFEIDAVMAGKTTVQFVQARSFEPSHEPHAVREIHLTVVP